MLLKTRAKSLHSAEEEKTSNIFPARVDTWVASIAICLTAQKSGEDQRQKFYAETSGNLLELAMEQPYENGGVCSQQ